MNGLFITGTDTGVGKTHVACTLIAALRQQGRRVGAYKPVCSGADLDARGQLVWGDQEALWEALGRDVDPARVCPQRFRAPLAPPVAAHEEGRWVDAEALRKGVDWWRNQVDLLIVEGAGGLLSPLTWTETNRDLAADLGWPLLIVAANRLGCVNQTLLTIEAARSGGLQVKGVLLCDVARVPDSSAQTNLELLLKFSDAAWVGSLAYESRAILTRRPAESGLDWRKLVDEGGSQV